MSDVRWWRVCPPVTRSLRLPCGPTGPHGVITDSGCRGCCTSRSGASGRTRRGSWGGGPGGSPSGPRGTCRRRCRPRSPSGTPRWPPGGWASVPVLPARPDGLAVLYRLAVGVEVGLLPWSLARLRAPPAADDAGPYPHGVGEHDDDHEREEDREDAVDRRVRDDLLHVGLGLRVAVELVVPGRLDCGASLREEAERRVGGEDLLEARRQRNRGVPSERQPRHPGVLQLAHLYEDGGADGEGDGGEELVGDAEEWEELVDAALRVVHAGVEEVPPAADDEGARDQVTRQPRGTRKGPVDVAEQVLEHEPPDARAGVDGGQDEQRLEHDGEVVPESLQGRAADDAREDLGHPDRQGRGAAGPADDAVLADVLGGLLEVVRRDREAEPVDRLGGGLEGVAEGRRRGVHGEVDAGVEGGRGDEGHHGDERLDEHGPVADHPHLRLFLDKLGRGPGGYERVEPG